MPATAILRSVLKKNAGDASFYATEKPAVHTKPDGAVKPLRSASAKGYVRSHPVKSTAAALALALTGYQGGKALVNNDYVENAVGNLGHTSAVQGAAGAMDAVGNAANAAGNFIADPFAKSDPNSQPLPPPAKPGMLEQYWKNLKSGDPTTMVGTGAAALLAAVLTHNLLKKRSKR